jgi:hypothetical protein
VCLILCVCVCFVRACVCACVNVCVCVWYDRVREVFNLAESIHTRIHTRMHVNLKTNRHHRRYALCLFLWLISISCYTGVSMFPSVVFVIWRVYVWLPIMYEPPNVCSL